MPVLSREGKKHDIGQEKPLNRLIALFRMPGRSQAARFGRLAEEAAQEKYNLAPAHNEWRDLIFSNGVPVNVKSCKFGGEERFRLWERDHTTLAQNQGYYVFIVYIPRGKGIQVRQIRRKKAYNVTELVDQWNESGHRRKRQRQFKLPAKRIF